MALDYSHFRLALRFLLPHGVCPVISHTERLDWWNTTVDEGQLGKGKSEEITQGDIQTYSTPKSGNTARSLSGHEASRQKVLQAFFIVILAFS